MELNKLHQLFLKSTGVSTDTRSVQRGNMFFALKGPSFNGNAFAEKALDSGAAYAIVDEPKYALDKRFILTDDALTTLQNLARFHRQQFTGKVFALTGSNGKTTTKELINCVLSTKFSTLATVGNLNNHIGVPLTLLQIKPDTEVAIIEMGANHVGEINLLSSIALPDAGLITNIGKAHIGTFGGFENIIRGKSELYDFLLKNGGDVLLNVTDPVLNNMKHRFSKSYTYPVKGSFLEAELLESNPFIIYKDEDGKKHHTQLTGAYNFNNIAAALAVGKYFQVANSAAHEAIASYIPANNRSQIIEKEGLKIILDAYNANPSSMEAALRNLAAMDSDGKKTAILGDMFELGKDEIPEHQKLGTLVYELGIHPIFVGKLMKHAHVSCGNGLYFESTEQLLTSMENHPFEGLLLIKGSRGMKLERVVNEI